MTTHKTAIPTMEEGLNAPICPHFGHAEMFVIVEHDFEKKTVVKTETLQNPPHESGGCMRPVMLLKDKGVDSIILTGIGQRPLMGFLQQNVVAFQGIAGTVQENMQALWENKLPQIYQGLCNH